MSPNRPAISERRDPRKTTRWLLLFLFFALPAAGALLSLVELVQSDVGGVENLLSPSGVAVSPEGKHVYATAELSSSLVAFRRDATNDTLTYLESFVDGQGGVFALGQASAVAVSPDGQHVYATSINDDAVVIFRRDATNDSLSFANVVMQGINGVFGLDSPVALAVSPNNRYVHVASSQSNSLAVFRRSATNDDLVLVDVEREGDAGLTGMVGATAVASSPDSNFIHVAARGDDTISVFRRDGSLDDFVLVDQVENQMAGISGLDGVSAVVVSPDGRHLYATSQIDDSVTVFERDMLGQLSQIAVYVDGGNGGTALAGAQAIAISPEGNLVFVASPLESAVTVFHRHAGSGELRVAEIVRDGLGGIDGLAGAIALAVSPDAVHVYVAAAGDDAVSGFRVVQILFFDDFESGDVSAWSASAP